MRGFWSVILWYTPLPSCDIGTLIGSWDEAFLVRSLVSWNHRTGDRFTDGQGREGTGKHRDRNGCRGDQDEGEDSETWKKDLVCNYIIYMYPPYVYMHVYIYIYILTVYIVSIMDNRRGYFEWQVVFCFVAFSCLCLFVLKATNHSPNRLREQEVQEKQQLKCTYSTLQVKPVKLWSLWCMTGESDAFFFRDTEEHCRSGEETEIPVRLQEGPAAMLLICEKWRVYSGQL